MTIELTGLDHVVLRTTNRQTMLDFYCRVLGARVERTLESIGLYQLRAGESLIDLVDLHANAGGAQPQAPDPVHANMDHFCLRVANFDAKAIRAHLGNNGVSAGAVEDRYGAQGSGPSIYLADPDGNTVELKGPARPGTRLDAG